MPAAITHYFQGKTVAAALGLEESQAFTLGCQGPDILFAHRFFPWQRGRSLAGFGSFLHDTPAGELFDRLQSLAKEQDSLLLRNYMRGFLCHYATDRTCHPYVNTLAARLNDAEPGQDTGIFHNEIESALDVIVLRRETGKLPSQFRLQDTMACGKELADVLAPFYAALARTYGEDVPEDLVRQALKDTYFAYSVLGDRTGGLYRLARLLEGKGKRSLSCHFRPMLENADVDYANVNGGEWEDPVAGSTRDASFFDLFDEAVADARGLLAAYEAGEPLKERCNRHF